MNRLSTSTPPSASLVTSQVVHRQCYSVNLSFIDDGINVGFHRGLLVDVPF